MHTLLRFPHVLALALACHSFAFALRAHTPAEEMADAATHFLAALSPEQKTKATFELKDDERLNWHFIPKARKGLPLKEMTPAQRHLAHALLNTALSQRGYMKASTIMSLEQILAEIEQGRGPVRDPELYFVSIFGKPGAKETWAWRWEGHHLAMNFSIAGGDKVSMTPSFMGSNPGEVRVGQRSGLRVLKQEEEIARKLVHSLDAKQRQAAIYTNTAPADIITSADRKARLLTPAGLAMSEMNKDQQGLLMDLLKEYVYRNRGEVAEKDLKRIQDTGAQKITFAWAGSTEPGQGHYYRIQGQTFLMEYDNTQNKANHIHAVWRDLENDFGGDLLRRHYEQDHAK
ncbi:MAG: DUF3500 domain-containing protein [Verrucomicrobiales bacterium]|nr:DUF3500 domain-containing protein [Verrucomicrobiales bacterium]